MTVMFSEGLTRPLVLRGFVNPSRGGIELWVRVGERRDGKVTIAKPLTLETMDEQAAYNAEPCCIMRMEEAQGLMDSLWDCGLRPQAAKSGDAQIAALNGHLQDMRQIAFASVKIEKP